VSLHERQGFPSFACAACLQPLASAKYLTIMTYASRQRSTRLSVTICDTRSPSTRSMATEDTSPPDPVSPEPKRKSCRISRRSQSNGSASRLSQTRACGGFGTSGKAPHPMPAEILMLPQDGTEAGMGVRVRCIAQITEKVETITRHPLDGLPHSSIYSY
jgi:hypothetical protein